MQLIVLGMHRSGTSAVTRVLNMMGAYFGPEGAFTDTGFGEYNEKGFWERKDVRELNQQILDGLKCDWDRVAKFDLDRLPRMVKLTFERRAKLLVLNLDAHRPWVVKDPRMCLCFGLWRPLLELPVIVYVVRNPIQIAQSLERRNQFPLQLGLALWEKYNLAALASSAQLPHVVVSHEDLMRDPAATVQKLHEDLTRLDVAPLRLPSDSEIRSFIDPKLQHASGDEALFRETANPEQIALFESLRDGSAFQQSKLPELSSEARDTLQAHETSSEKEPPDAAPDANGPEEDDRATVADVAEIREVTAVLEKAVTQIDEYFDQRIDRMEKSLGEARDREKEEFADLRDNVARNSEGQEAILAQLAAAEAKHLERIEKLEKHLQEATAQNASALEELRSGITDIKGAIASGDKRFAKGIFSSEYRRIRKERKAYKRLKIRIDDLESLLGKLYGGIDDQPPGQK